MDNPKYDKGGYKKMSWSKQALGANGAAESETRKQKLVLYLKKTSFEKFNVIECYKYVFYKQSKIEQGDMKSIATLNKYFKDLEKAGATGRTLDRGIQETKLLMNIRNKRMKSEKEARDQYAADYGIIIGDRSLE